MTPATLPIPVYHLALGCLVAWAAFGTLLLVSGIAAGGVRHRSRADRLFWLAMCGPLVWALFLARRLVGWLFRGMFQGDTIPLDDPPPKPPVGGSGQPLSGMTCPRCERPILPHCRPVVQAGGRLLCAECNHAVDPWRDSR